MGSVGRRVEEPHTAELQPLVSPFRPSNIIVPDIAGLVYSLPFFFLSPSPMDFKQATFPPKRLFSNLLI